ncbi:MAG: DUF4169 family protein [Pseudomonadota bacterium]
MTGKVVNLKAHRKALARDAKAKTGQQNAAKHGRTKSARNADADAKARAEFLLDAHRRDEPEA